MQRYVQLASRSLLPVQEMFPFSGEDSATEQRIAIKQETDYELFMTREIQIHYIDAKIKCTKGKPNPNPKNII